jgi:hypothetical protein
MTCPKCGYCEHCKRNDPAPPLGPWVPNTPNRDPFGPWRSPSTWYCSLCGQRVSYGQVHTCITYRPITTSTGSYPITETLP